MCTCFNSSLCHFNLQFHLTIIKKTIFSSINTSSGQAVFMQVTSLQVNGDGAWIISSRNICENYKAIFLTTQSARFFSMQLPTLIFRLDKLDSVEFSRVTDKHWLNSLPSGSIASSGGKFTNSSWPHQANVELQFPDAPDVQKSIPTIDLSGMHKVNTKMLYYKYYVKLFNSLAKHSFSFTDSMLASCMFLVQHKDCAAVYESYVYTKITQNIYL